MDVGTLTGHIVLEDELTSTLSRIATSVKKFALGWKTEFGLIAVSSLAAVTAIGTVTGAIIGLAQAGSTINDVEESFDNLAKQAGTTGEALIRGLTAGVRGTVDSMILMQSTTRVLQSGMKLTEADMKVLGITARAMGKATGTDAASGLRTLSNALTTGQTRALRMAGVTVDLEKAQRALAKELGVEVKNLSQSGKLHAARTAIMEASRNKVAQLGDAELTFKEKIQAANVSIGNWFDNLKKAVDKLPSVNKALDDIGGALVKAFGSGTQTLLQMIVGWIDTFASNVSRYGPPIIEAIADIGKGIYGIWKFVKQAWDDVPDWFKEIAKEALLAGIAVGIVHKGMEAVSGGSLLTDIASFATIWNAFGDKIAKAGTAIKEFALRLGPAIEKFGLLAVGNSVIMKFLMLPWVKAAIIVGAIYTVTKSILGLYDAWKTTGSMWSFFSKGGGFWDNSMIGNWLGMSKAIDATADSLKKLKAITPAPSHGLAPMTPVPSHGPAAKPPESLIDLEEVKKERIRLLQEGLVQEQEMRRQAAGMRNRQMDSENEIELAKFVENENAKLAAIEIGRENQLTAERAGILAKNQMTDAMYTEQYNAIVRHYNDVEQYSTGALQNEAIRLRTIYEEMASRPREFSKETIARFKEIAQAAQDAADGVRTGWGNAFKAIFEGGGFKSLGKMLKGSLGDIKTGIFEGFGNIISSGLTSLINKGMSLLGEGVKKLWNGIAGTAGRDAIREFAEKQGGFDALHDKLGKLGAKGEQLWITLTQGVGRNNADQAKRAIDQVTSALDKFNFEQEETFRLMDEYAKEQDFLVQTMQKYGIAWNTVSKEQREVFAATELSNYKKEFDVLVKAGVDINEIWRRMGDGVSDFVLEAKNSGTVLDESFKPMLQTAIDAGELFTVSTEELAKLREEAEKLGKPFDESAYKVGDLAEAGVTFGETMQEATSRVATAIEQLVKVLTEKLTPAINNIPDVTIGVHYKPDEFPSGGYDQTQYAASGGYVTQNNVVPFRPRGTDTVPAMLTPGEVVLPAGTRATGGGGGTVVIQLDRRTLAELVVPEIPGVVKRYGLGR